jgi:transcriptional regulator with XRE-family HTH domain
MDLKAFSDKTNLEIMDYLSAKIRAERKRRKLSQEQFALLAGISVRTFKRFEQDCNGSVDNLINVFRAFGKVNFFQAVAFENVQDCKPAVILKIEGAHRKSLSRD